MYVDIVTGVGKVIDNNYDFTGFAADKRMLVDAMLSTDSVGRPLFIGQDTARRRGPQGITSGAGLLAGLPAYFNQGVSGKYWRQGDKTQTVTINGSPTGGTFTLSSGGNTTSALAYNATAAAVQTAIRRSAASTRPSPVTGSAGGPYTITFPDATSNVQSASAPFGADGTALTGGTSAVGDGRCDRAGRHGHEPARDRRRLVAGRVRRRHGPDLRISQEASYFDGTTWHSAFQENLVLAARGGVLRLRDGCEAGVRRLHEGLGGLLARPGRGRPPAVPPGPSTSHRRQEARVAFTAPGLLIGVVEAHGSSASRPVTVYRYGTTTPAAVYADQARTVPLAGGVVTPDLYGNVVVWTDEVGVVSVGRVDAGRETVETWSVLPPAAEIASRLTAAEGDIAAIPSDAAAGTPSLRSLGTTSTKAAAGNDSRITGAAQKSSDLSDLASPSTARTNLGLGSAATHATTDYDAAGAALTVQGGLDTLSAALPATYARSRMPVATRPNILTRGLSDGTATQKTYRVQHTVPVGCNALQIVLGNWTGSAGGFGQESDPPNPFVVRVSVETPLGTFLPVYFNGRRDVRIEPGSSVVESDPVGSFPAGPVWVRYRVSVAALGMQWPLGLYTNGGAAAGSSVLYPAAQAAEGNGGSATDAVDSGAITFVSEVGVYSAVAIVGRPVTPRHGLALLGDSIMLGTGVGTPAQDAGFAVQALNNTAGYVLLARSGETVADWITTGTSRRRKAVLAYCDRALMNYAANDYQRTLVAIKADLLTAWQQLDQAGIRVWHTTATPRTSSTDAWATVGNQTDLWTAGVRAALNDWIRTIPAPLAGYFEVADTVESARNSGKWAANLTIDGVHPTAAAHTLMAAAVNPTTLVA
jgi:lysophospholipase L1-like esterase